MQESFGFDALQLREIPPPDPGPGEVRVRVHATSLNFRDVLVISGRYNPRLELPFCPLSDGAGIVEAVGPGVEEWKVGQRVLSHYACGWEDGPFDRGVLARTLGTPGPGLAADEVVLPAEALVALPDALTFEVGATLPIAALTAWSCLVTEGELRPDQWVLTLGTGGVSIFALQMAKAIGARVIVTSSSDEKLERARALGADGTVNYARNERWDKEVATLTEGRGAHVVVENGGVGTLSRSLKAVRAGGVVALPGALTGLVGEVDIAPILMKRVRVAGIFVDTRRALREMIAFLATHALEPVIDARFDLEELPQALEQMREQRHFGKIVLRHAHEGED